MNEKRGDELYAAQIRVRSFYRYYGRFALGTGLAMFGLTFLPKFSSSKGVLVLVLIWAGLQIPGMLWCERKARRRNGI